MEVVMEVVGVVVGPGQRRRRRAGKVAARLGGSQKGSGGGADLDDAGARGVELAAERVHLLGDLLLRHGVLDGRVRRLALPPRGRGGRQRTSARWRWSTVEKRGDGAGRGVVGSGPRASPRCRAFGGALCGRRCEGGVVDAALGVRRRLGDDGDDAAASAPAPPPAIAVGARLVGRSGRDQGEVRESRHAPARRASPRAQQPSGARVVPLNLATSTPPARSGCAAPASTRWGGGRGGREGGEAGVRGRRRGAGRGEASHSAVRRDGARCSAGPEE